MSVHDPDATRVRGAAVPASPAGHAAAAPDGDATRVRLWGLRVEDAGRLEVRAYDGSATRLKDELPLHLTSRQVLERLERGLL